MSSQTLRWGTRAGVKQEEQEHKSIDTRSMIIGIQFRMSYVRNRIEVQALEGGEVGAVG